jgi:exodeoxyribonuclease VII large subunit
MYTERPDMETDPLEPRGKRVLTVSQITLLIKALIESEPMLSNVSVRGEVTNLSRSKAGHIYFGLKDATGYIKCVAFRGAASRLKVQPEDGREIIASGQITVYEAGGVYQLIVESVEELGLGALWVKFEQLRKQLEKEGLFDEKLKRPLPAFPRQVGLVTSPDGAALRDMLRIFNEQAPYLKIILAPSLVQGDTAPSSLVRAIDLLEMWDEMERGQDRDGIDLIIIGRGGGSFEDLSCFNDEKLARRIRSAWVPVISAVGHEVDFSIADFVADLRAATPTQAAGLAVPPLSALLESIDLLLGEFQQAAEIKTETYRTGLDNILSRTIYKRPTQRINMRRQEIDSCVMRCGRAITSRIVLLKHRLEASMSHLCTLDPTSILARGYSLAFNAETGHLISRVGQVIPKTEVDLRVSDGTIKLKVLEGTEQK